MTPGPSLGACLDCSRKYGEEHGFPDLIVSNATWKKVCPEHAPGGLLCPSCLIRRLVRLGLTNVRAKFTSGPLNIVDQWVKP